MDRAGSRLRILIADDYADGADSLAMLLGLWGHDVRVACSGMVAEAIARSFRPHLALLELRLPGRDGYDLAARLRAEQGCGIRLFALTGYGDSVHQRMAMLGGFDCYLVKPIDPELLRHLVAHVVPGVEAPRVLVGAP